MKVEDRDLQSIVDIEAKDFAMYTIHERALPSIMDGLKPSQRFVLYSAIKNAMNEFKKVTAVGGVVSEYGYNHGENAAQEACALMSNTWSNNYPVLLGRGNFGSRYIQDAAQFRYIFCKVHDNFKRMFLDNDILPAHPKLDHQPPRFYIPSVPFVLLNGVVGIATGFSTNILPHSLESVVRCVRQVLTTGDCDEPEIQFPKFVGKIDTSTDNWFIEGLYEYQSPTKLLITEIPMRFDRVKYITVLDKLVDSDKIVSYEEIRGSNEFCFRVTLKRGNTLTHEQIVKMFCLRQGISQNINVIVPNGDKDELQTFETASDLIKMFVHIRLTFLKTRISTQLAAATKRAALTMAKVRFIESVRNGEIVLQGKTRKQLLSEIESYDHFKGFGEELVSMNIYHITDDELVKLTKLNKEANSDIRYWETTTEHKQFMKDLDELVG